MVPRHRCGLRAVPHRPTGVLIAIPRMNERGLCSQAQAPTANIDRAVTPEGRRSL